MIVQSFACVVLITFLTEAFLWHKVVWRGIINLEDAKSLLLSRYVITKFTGARNIKQIKGFCRDPLRKDLLLIKVETRVVAKNGISCFYCKKKDRNCHALRKKECAHGNHKTKQVNKYKYYCKLI